jgi:hypothetical protein
LLFVLAINLSNVHQNSNSTFHQLFHQQTNVSSNDVSIVPSSSLNINSSPSSSSSFISLSFWRLLFDRLIDYRNRQSTDLTIELNRILEVAITTLNISLPQLIILLESFAKQPAQNTIPHLRNTMGFNIQDYQQQIQTIVALIKQQQIKYNRQLKQRSMQQL